MENQRHRDSEWGQGPAAFPASPRGRRAQGAHSETALGPTILHVGVLSLFDVWGWALIPLHSDRMIYHLVGQGVEIPANICGMSPVVFPRGPSLIE